MGDQGVGASVKRKEDDRFLRGRGQFVGDIRLAGMKDVAFVRSPLAHAKLRAVRIPEEHRGKAFAAADLVGVKPIVAVSGLAGIQGVRAAGACEPEGAPGRRTHRDVRRPDTRRG